MSHWTFYDYVEEGGHSPFFEWMERLSHEAQAWIDARILQMAGMPRWPEKWASKCHGTEKIIELRIPFNKVQYRPLGMYARGFSFIFLEGAIEKGGKIPVSTIEIAIRRQKRIEADWRHVGQHRYY